MRKGIPWLVLLPQIIGVGLFYMACWAIENYARAPYSDHATLTATIIMIASLVPVTILKKNKQKRARVESIARREEARRNMTAEQIAVEAVAQELLDLCIQISDKVESGEIPLNEAEVILRVLREVK